MPSLDFWRTITLAVVALGQTLFVALYLTYPFWKSFLGRALFFKAIALALIVDAYLWYRLLPFPHADGVFVFLYAVLAAGVWFQDAAFLRVKIEHRENDR